MLQSIRDKATGPLAWVIVGIISVPFAFFGIEAFRSGGGGNDAAKVNGEPISRYAVQNRVEARYQQFAQMFGENFRADMFDRSQIRSGVLDEMINEEVTRQYLVEKGYRVSDRAVLEFIATQEAYQDENGNFSSELYKEALARQGSSSALYESRVRDYLAASQFENAIRDSVFVTTAQLSAEWADQKQTRNFQWRHYPLSAFTAQVEITEDDLRADYESQRDNLLTPERLQVDYLELSTSKLAAAVEISDEQVAAEYQANQERYREPETRQARHILVEDESEAEALRERISTGAIEFAKAAAENSTDPGSKDKGGDLGLVARGVMVPAFEAAVFSQEIGELGGPIKTQFGFHLIEVTGIQGGQYQPLEDVAADIRERLQKKQARERMLELRDELEQLSFENPTSLDPAAAALGMELVRSPWFTREGGAGITAETAVIQAAFSNPVLSQGENSQLLTLGERVLVLRLAEREAPRQQTFEEVRDQLELALRATRAREALRAAVDADLEVLANGTAWDALPQREGVEQKTEVDVARDSFSVDRGLMNAVFATGFSGEPEVAEATLQGAAGDLALFRLDSVTYGDWSTATDEDKSALRQRLQSQLAGAEIDAMISALRAEAEVYIAAESADEES